MRIIERPEKKKPEDGKTYVGTITDYRFVDMTSKKTGKAMKGIKIKIKPDDESMGNIEAFDWIGSDENGMFIYRGSKLDHWLQRVFNVSEVSSIRFDDIKGKKCLYVVSVTSKNDPSTNTLRTYYNVNDILSLPVGAFVSAPAPQPMPAQPYQATQPIPTPVPQPMPAQPYQTPQPVQPTQPLYTNASQSTAASAAPVQNNNDWSNGEIL